MGDRSQCAPMPNAFTSSPSSCQNPGGVASWPDSRPNQFVFRLDQTPAPFAPSIHRPSEQNKPFSQIARCKKKHFWNVEREFPANSKMQHTLSQHVTTTTSKTPKPK